MYIVSHGWHTGFVIPAGSIEARLPELKRRFANAPYIELGWGDAGFYRANEITTGLTLRAIFWPTETVVHAVSVPRRPDAYFSGSEVSSICIDDNGYAALLEYIENSFARDEHGRIVPTGHGLYGDSEFYRGVGDYYLMNTCNKWTAKGLRSAGLSISPMFKLTAGSVMDYLSTQEADVSGRCEPTGTLRP